MLCLISRARLELKIARASVNVCVCGERGGVEVRWLVRWQSKQQISPIKVAGRRAEGCNWYHCHQLIIEEIKWLLKLLSNLDFLSRSQDINIPFNSLLEALRSDKNIMCEWLLSVGWILWDSKHLCSTLHITHVETHIVKLSSWLKSSTKQREQRITLVRLENERHSSESDQISEMKSRDVSSSYMLEISNVSLLKYKGEILYFCMHLDHGKCGIVI